MYIWVRSRNCFPFASTRVHPLFVGGVCVAHYLGFCVVLLRVIAFWVPRCGVCCDFHVDAMFRLSLPPVVCRSASVLFPLFGLFVCGCVQHVLCWVFVLLFFVLLPVSPVVHVLIVLSVSSIVYSKSYAFSISIIHW